MLLSRKSIGVKTFCMWSSSYFPVDVTLNQRPYIRAGVTSMCAHNASVQENISYPSVSVTAVKCQLEWGSNVTKKGDTRVRTGDLSICSRMLYH